MRCHAGVIDDVQADAGPIGVRRADHGTGTNDFNIGMEPVDWARPPATKGEIHDETS